MTRALGPRMINQTSASVSVPSTTRTFLSVIEVKVLALFAFGLALNALVIRLPLGFVAAAWGAGLFFEYSTKSLWTYHPQIVQSVFTVRGVNWLLGLGWVGAVLCGIALGRGIEAVTGLPRLASVVLGVGLGGNAAEQLFHWLELFRYNLNERLLSFPFKKTYVLFHIPASVRLGYFSSIAGAAYLLSRAFGQ